LYTDLKTKFVKFSSIKDVHYSQWSQFFIAGDSWLEVLQILIDNKDKLYFGRFYVTPTIVTFCLELYVKTLVSNLNPLINFKIVYKHRIVDIIKDFSDQIPIFNKLIEQEELINLIREFQNTIDARYGQTAVTLNGDDQIKLIDLIYELRNEICKITGLK